MDDVKKCKKGGCLCLEDELSVAKVNLALVLAFGDAGALVLCRRNRWGKGREC